MNYRRQRAKIGEKEEVTIASYVLDYPNMTRTNLAEKIQQEVDWPDKPPQIEVLERKISAYRKNKPKNPQDEPWSLSTLETIPISGDALPVVLKEYKRLNLAGQTLTIRQAKWISRLYKIDLQNSGNIYNEVVIADRFDSVGVSNAYIIAKVEQFYELLGMKADLEGYTKLLSGFPSIEDNNWTYLLASASVAGILKNDPTKSTKKG